MPNASVLQFKNYTVEELLYEQVPTTENQQEFHLNTNFSQKLIDIGNNNYDVKLSAEILPTEEQPTPFKLRVSIIGHFAYLDNGTDANSSLKEQILRKNTGAILFPFLRQIIASLTNIANIPTLMLPIINFNDNPIKD